MQERQLGLSGKTGGVETKQPPGLGKVPVSSKEEECVVWSTVLTNMEVCDGEGGDGGTGSWIKL